jgi:hypothetical protein
VKKPSIPLGQRGSTGNRVPSAALTLPDERSVLMIAFNPSQTNGDILRQADDDAMQQLHRMILHLNEQHSKWRFR